jgi:thioredoxin-related protein
MRISLLITLLAGCMVSLGPAAEPVKPKPKVTKWIPLWEGASLQARKEKKVILAYFSGSDWEPFTQKLEKEVLNTDLFRDWAAKNVILLQIDYPREKQLSPSIKGQNERLKQRYSIVKIPTFIFMDYSGLPFARAGWDEARLRDDEAKEQPKAWIKFLDETLRNKPPDEALVKQKNLTECMAYGKKHFISSVILINHDRIDRTLAAKEDLTHNQQYVKFMNRNVAYCEVEWPFDGDNSPDAAAFRTFAAAQNIQPSSLELCVYDMQTNKVNFRLTSIDPARADNIVKMVEEHLPKIDYNSGWIDDYHMATAIAQQQKRYIFICFTSMDSSEYSKKIFDEIFNSDDFQKFARKRLVTLQIDFPTVAATAATQPAGLVAQNKTLAEMYAVKGFPQVIVMNPLAQKIGDAKYMKGGPAEFLKQLQIAIKADEERRAFLAGE